MVAELFGRSDLDPSGRLRVWKKWRCIRARFWQDSRCEGFSLSGSLSERPQIPFIGEVLEKARMVESLVEDILGGLPPEKPRRLA